ncbi:DUF2264 domain-containing protein [Glaciihabitans tibetensis]|uniref:DUF2264 domain-containing protein n=1 Tax=Glaciihabitans tibetensis TaxID=1266600 RepID=UPI000D075CA8|nr:DUF2264 domain-containing protein [Glaciihabitans tibetensis]
MTDSETAVTPDTAPATADWTRTEWVAYADRVLAGAQAFASPNNARITPPGAEGGYGRAIDGLEGFARTFLLAGFRIVGERGQGDAIEELAAFYARGITAGVDPTAPDRWVRLDEHAQAKVEAASIALILDMTRPWIWARLDDLTQQRVIDYFSPVVGDTTYPQTNWVWFRLVVQTFLRSVGGPWSADDVADDLARHDTFARSEGWMSDGDERSFDHYVGWALHLYPVLWSRMQGASELANGRTAADIVALDRFLLDAVALVGADGSPLLQGRSLIYRFAAAAPFWVGVLAEVPSLSAGALRHAANKVVAHFAEHTVPTADGILTMGWHDEWRGLAQSYSGPGSPYWAVKGLLGVMLPADHEVWSATSAPLPIENADTLLTVNAAGWIVSGTSADGIVRVINHGTDHATDGSLVGDSPLYARLGYSTATSPLLDTEAWENPLEQSVTIVDSLGRATHRAAMQLTEVRLQDDADGTLAIAASVSDAHWVTAELGGRRHGSGLDGAITVAGPLSVHSLVRGAWEVRLARLESLESGLDAASLRLRIGGWPLAGIAPITGETGDAAWASEGTLLSRISCLQGDAGVPQVAVRPNATPLAPVAAVPFLDFPVVAGDWVAVLVELSGAQLQGAPLSGAQLPGSEPDDQQSPSVEILDHGNEWEVEVVWPDGRETSSLLPKHRRPSRTDR